MNVNPQEVTNILRDIKDAIAQMKLVTAASYARSLSLIFPQAKKLIINFQNSVKSISDGMADSELTQRQLKDMAAKDYVKFEIGVNSLLADLQDKEEPLKKEITQDQLTKFESGENDIKTHLIRNDFFIGYTTIVPITKPRFSTEALIRNGFKAEDFEYYALLGKQLVCGLKSEYIKRNMEKGMTATDVFNEFKETVQARYKGMQLMQLGKDISWWDTSWCWLIPAKHLNLLKKSTLAGASNSNLNVQSWGFPFDRS